MNLRRKRMRTSFILIIKERIDTKKKTPELVKECGEKFSLQVLNLLPIFLEELFEEIYRGGYDVPTSH